MTQSYTLTQGMPTIFRIDDWGLQAIDTGEYANIKIDSIIIHNCSSVHTTGDWMIEPMIIIQEFQLSRPCVYCHKVAPDEIQALWRLQNMDKL